MLGLSHALLTGVERLANVRRCGCRPCPDIAEVLLCQVEPLLKSQVPCYREHRIAGPVVVAVEPGQVRDGGPSEFLLASVSAVAVLPSLEGMVVDVDPHEAAVGRIRDVRGDLLRHHGALVDQLLFSEVQGLHPVRLQPEDGFKRRRRDDRYVVRVIGTRERRHEAAATVDDPGVNAVSSPGCPLEH